MEIFKKFFKTGKTAFFSVAALVFLCLTFAIQFVFLNNPGLMGYLFKSGTKVFRKHELKKVQLLENDMQIRALVKREDGRLKLEIFQTDGKGRKIFEKSVGRYPVFAEYKKEGVFLDALDFDGDGALDLVVSSMDSRFRPDFHIFQYNKRKGRFEERKLFRSDFL